MARRAELRIALVALGLAALLLIVTFAARGVDDIYRGDAQSFRLVAEQPFGSGAELRADPDVGDQGVAYRYGRILFPLVGWTLAGGQSGAVKWLLPASGVIAFGACAGLAALLCAQARQPAQRGLLVVGVPTLISSTVLVYAEPLAIALVLAAFLTYLNGNKRATLLAASLVLLTREAFIVGLLPLAVAEWRDGSSRRMPAAMGLVVFPYAMWLSWVRWRVGEWPLLDSSTSRKDAIGLPVASVWHAIRDAEGDVVVVTGAVLVAVIGLCTFLVAVAVFTRREHDRLLAAGLLAFATLGLFVGPQGYRFSGDGLRVLLPGHIMLALVAARHQWPVRSTETTPSTSTAAPSR